MMAAGIKSPDVLDELESHLREDVERQEWAGVTAEQAFREAVQRVGAAENLNREFAKVRGSGSQIRHNTMRAVWITTAAFVFAILTWTLLIYDIMLPERVFGIALVTLIAGFIGALPDLNRLQLRGVRGWALRKAIAAACTYAVLAWMCLLWLSLLHIDILPMGIVAGTICWGFVAALSMTLMAFVFGVEQEARDLWDPAAWRSLELAGAEAARFHHDFIGTEHVLLGLLGDENGKVRKVLENCGVRREAVRAEIEKWVGTGPKMYANRPPAYTPRAKKAFEFAIREAKAARANRAEPEHVLLGLLGGCGGVAAEILTRMGVDAKKVREQIRKQIEGVNDHE